jgi:hypothetical protein
LVTRRPDDIDLETLFVWRRLKNTADRYTYERYKQAGRFVIEGLGVFDGRQESTGEVSWRANETGLG